MSERIPGPIARPIIQKYLSEYEVCGDEHSGIPVSDPRFQRSPSPLKILAEESGVKRDTLEKFLKGRNDSIDLYALDRVLCAMGKTFLWYQEPLVSLYVSGTDE